MFSFVITDPATGRTVASTTGTKREKTLWVGRWRRAGYQVTITPAA